MIQFFWKFHSNIFVQIKKIWYAEMFKIFPLAVYIHSNIASEHFYEWSSWETLSDPVKRYLIAAVWCRVSNDSPR